MSTETKFTPDQQLRALSWKNPYAELMLHGKIETRTWTTKYRGWVLICASQKPYKFAEVSEISGYTQQQRILLRVDKTNAMRHDGHAIALAKLVDCRPMEKEDEDKCFVAFNPSLFCHVYESVTPIEHFDWKGSQGWKEVSSEIKNQIKLL